jgi:Holliday junction resolvase
MSAADKGARREREARDYLRSCGYYVVKAGGSKGAADLVAVRPGVVLFVQVKCGRGRLRPPEWNALLELARRYGALPILAEREDRQPFAWWLLNGAKPEGGRGPQPYSRVDPAWWETWVPSCPHDAADMAGDAEGLERLAAVSGIDPHRPRVVG